MSLDIFGNNPLREAIYGKRAGMVRLLLQRGSDPNQINKDGESMKDIAAKHGTAEIQTILAAKSGGQ